MKIKLLPNKILKNIFAIAVLFSISIGMGFAQLSGTNYTIDAAAATGGTNFKTFNDLRAALASGVSGPVKVTVKAGSGPYTEQVSFSPVSGASATNTITIDGNGEIIQHGGYYVIRLNGADRFTLDDLHIKNTRTGDSYQRCVWMNSSADYNTVINCELTMPNTYSRDYASCYIGISQSNSSYRSYGDPGENILIENNKMYSADRKGPGCGILVVNESSGSTIHKVIIKNNEIKNFYRYGYYGYKVSQANITGNEIHNTGTYGHQSGNTNKYGIYHDAYRKSIGVTEINDNYIHNLDSSSYTGSHYGIYMYAYYASGTSIELDNNNINITSSQGGGYGIYAYGYQSTFTKFYKATNNYIEIESQSKSSSTYTYAYGLYNFATYYNRYVDEIQIENNELHLSSSYYIFGIYAYAYYCNGLTVNTRIINNIINAGCDGYAYGLYIYAYQANKDFEILNNTINLEGWKNGNFSRKYTAYGMYLYYGRGRVENNIVQISKRKGGTSYCIYRNYGNERYAQNNLHIDVATTQGSKYYGYWSGNKNSFSNWTSSANSASTSTNHEALFVNPTSKILIPTNPNLVNAGKVQSGVPKGIFGTTRSLTAPDIGAIEFYYDIAVTSVTITGANECAGYDEDVKITLKNNNGFKMPYLSVDIYKDGILLGTAQTSGAVAGGASADILYNITFIGSGTQVVEARLSNDENVKNNSNTASIAIFAAPSGGEFSENTGSGAMHMLGTFDVTIIPNGLIYDVTAPTGSNNAGYGTFWDAKVSTTYASGTPVATADAAVWAGSTSANGTITLMPTSTVIDSLLTITLRVYNVFSGCDTSITRNVLIAPEGVPSFISPVVNCANEAVAFDNTSTVSTGSLTYEWDFDDGGTSVLTHPIHKYAAPGTYQVKLTTTTHPWEYKNSITIPVTVTAVPVALFTRLNACEGSDITLTNTSTGGTDYTWNFGDLAKPDVYTKDAAVQYTPGGYTVTLTAEANGCSDMITKPVYQFAMPVAAFTNTSGACNTDEFTFMNGSTISDGSVGYTWDFDDMNNGNALLSTNENPTIMFTNPGDHNVKLTAVSEFGCENTVTQTVGVKEGPAVSFTYSGGCSEEATVFTNGTTFPTVWNANHKWNFGDGSAISGDVNPSHNWNTTGDLDVTLTVDLDNGCSGMSTQTIKVAPQPVADFSVNDECVGNKVVFANNSTWEEGNITFTWDFDGAITGGTNDIAPKGIAMTAGTYDVKLIAKVSEGCSNEITKTVTISEAPISCQILATEDHANGFNGYKFESSVDGTNAGTESNVSYYWIIENHGNRNGSSVNVDFQEEGDFTVSLTARNDNTGCECTSSMNHNNVGIGDNLTAVNNFVVYPNPANSKLTIEMESGIAKGASIELINAVGATVMVVESKNIVDGKVVIDVNDLASGLYLVRITSGQTISTKKVSITN